MEGDNPNNQQPEVQQNIQPPASSPPPASQPESPPTQKPITKQSFFSRLYAGRINRRGYFIGLLVIMLAAAFIVAFNLFGMFLLNVIFGPDNIILPKTDSPQTTAIPNSPGYLAYLALNIVSAIFIIIFILWMYIFGFSLLIRRFHDLGKKGWFSLLIFIPFINVIIHLYLLFATGAAGENMYGNPSDPKVSLKTVLGLK